MVPPFRHQEFFSSLTLARNAQFLPGGALVSVCCVSPSSISLHFHLSSTFALCESSILIFSSATSCQNIPQQRNPTPLGHLLSRHCIVSHTLAPPASFQTNQTHTFSDCRYRSVFPISPIHIFSSQKKILDDQTRVNKPPGSFT